MQQGGFAISGETIVEEILDRFPLAATVFVRHRMHCVGCPIARFETLAEASRIYRQALDELLAELRAVTQATVDAATPPASIEGGHHG
jgi:hybrid cluster-associated redox disulfide protein